MPYVSELQGLNISNPSSLHPETVPLFLPSQVPGSLRNQSGLGEKEQRLRRAQAEDALIELRRLLRITGGLWQYKQTQVGPGQKANTRARSLITRFQSKVMHTANRYRAARQALLALDPHGGWIMRLRELKADDVKGPKRDDDEAEGTRQLSWIWLTPSGEQLPTPNSLNQNEIDESKSDFFQCETSYKVVYRSSCGMDKVSGTSFPLVRGSLTPS